MKTLSNIRELAGALVLFTFSAVYYLYAFAAAIANFA